MAQIRNYITFTKRFGKGSTERQRFKRISICHYLTTLFNPYPYTNFGSTPLSADIRARYAADQQNQKGSSPTNSYDNVLASSNELGMLADLDMGGSVRDTEMKRRHVFNDRPFCTYKVMYRLY